VRGEQEKRECKYHDIIVEVLGIDPLRARVSRADGGTDGGGDQVGGYHAVVGTAGAMGRSDDV
jgi:hypothetical protein